MKKVNIKSLITGIIIGIISTTTIFAGSEIKSAKYNDIELTIDNVKVEMNNPLISIVEEEGDSGRQYMPVREVLERIGLKVEWDGDENTIHVTSKPEYKSTYPEIEVSIKEKYISTETGEITFIMRNLTNKEIKHGDVYKIEVKEDGRWKECVSDVLEGESNIIGSRLEGEGQSEAKIKYSNIYGKLPAGEYRLVKNFYQEKEIIVKVEFEVRP